MMETVRLIGSLVVFIGSIFLFLGALGVFRMPDVYNRIQAGTKATTLGSIFVLAGIGIYQPSWLARCLMLAAFIVITNPLSSHALARAAHKSGTRLTEGSVVDKLREEEGDPEAAGSDQGPAEGPDSAQVSTEQEEGR